MNKKGYLRTIEAVIAIIIILGFTYSVTPKASLDVDAVPYSVEVAQETILRTIVDTESAREQILREDILMDSTTDTIYEPSDITLIIGDDYEIEADLPPGYNYALAVCIDSGCISEKIRSLEKSVYMDDIIVTDGTKTRIVRLWFWPKG